MIDQLTLGQRLYLFAHTPTGAPLTDRRTLRIALAGATLIDLAIDGCIHITGNRVDVHPDRPGADPLQDTILRQLATVPAVNRSTHHVIRRLATDIDTRTAGLLIATGTIAPARRDRQGPCYHHTSPRLRTDLVRHAIADNDNDAQTLSTCAMRHLITTLNLALFNICPQRTPARRPMPADATVATILCATEEIITELP